MFCEVVLPFPSSLLKLPSISRYCNNVVITPRRSEWMYQHCRNKIGMNDVVVWEKKFNVSLGSHVLYTTLGSLHKDDDVAKENVV